MTGCCEHGNERSDFRKGGEFLELLSYCQLLELYIVPWSWFSCSQYMS
jgi:hypothetical protein